MAVGAVTIARSVTTTEARRLLPHHLTTHPYYRACEGKHCGHLCGSGKLSGLYDCLTMLRGQKAKTFPTRYPSHYGYAPYNCYFAPCSPSASVSRSTSVDVDVDVNASANVYGGWKGSATTNTNVNVDVDVN